MTVRSDVHFRKSCLSSPSAPLLRFQERIFNFQGRETERNNFKPHNNYSQLS